MGVLSPDTFRCASDSAGTPLSEISGFGDRWDFPSLYTMDRRFSRRCLTLLLDAGADPTVVSEDPGSKRIQSPLHTTLDIATHSQSGPFYPSGIESDDEEIFRRMIRENPLYLNVATLSTMGPSIWLSAFLSLSKPNIRILRYLLEAGCDINETTRNLPGFPDGWNCLLLQVSRAVHPKESWDFERLRFLLRQNANIWAKDASGLTIFDHVNTVLCQLAAYQRDLWYCALRREGIDIGQANKLYPRTAIYGRKYSPKHYRALCYLDTWTGEDLSQQVHDTLKTHPWTEDEAAELLRMHNKKARERERREKRLEKADQIRERERLKIRLMIRDRMYNDKHSICEFLYTSSDDSEEY